MVGVFKLALGLSAVAGTLAVPAAVEQRGPPNFIFDENHPLAIARRAANLTLMGRSNTNYNQDYTTGGTVNFTPGTNQFSVSWNTQDDIVVGVGWNPGSNIPITHSGSFTVSSGLGSLSVYGWTTNPLVEYYIMDCNVGITVGGTEKGTVTSDGASYTIWEHQQVNQPSIQGSSSTFNQYISIRNSCTSSGTVTVQNHFNAWASYGMTLGTMNYQVVSVESWSGAGSASQSVSNSGSGSTTTTTKTTTTTTKTTTTTSHSSTSTGSCAALYAQCGGQGWTGATCCSSGTCQAQSQYYSQCLT